MKRFFTLALTCSALTLSGCTTVEQFNADGTTYSGAARAAVSNQVASASTYVRGLFTKPLPAWQPAVTAQAPQQPPVVQPSAPTAKRDPSDSVQTHPVDLGGR
jgi:hypothetical protein